MAEKSITINVDAPRAAGDLTVSGFATKRTALDMGWVFAEAIRQRYPGATVRVWLNEEQGG